MKRQNLRTVSLIVVTFTYLLIGAAIFGYLESEHEMRQREQVDWMEKRVRWKYNITEDDYTVLTTAIIKSVPHKAGIQWKFPGAFYFATTVVTTIGYGHSTPSTLAGRSFCMVYALIGIPLGLVMFQSIGERLNTIVRVGLRRVKRCLRTKNPEVTQTNLVMVVLVLSTILMTSMAAIFAKYERWEYFDALYYCFITLTTIGFGDYVALQKESALQSKPEYVILSLVFILFGLSVVSSAVNLLVLKFLTLNTEDERRDEQIRSTAALDPYELKGVEITMNANKQQLAAARAKLQTNQTAKAGRLPNGSSSDNEDDELPDEDDNEDESGRLVLDKRVGLRPFPQTFRDKREEHSELDEPDLNYCDPDGFHESPGDRMQLYQGASNWCAFAQELDEPPAPLHGVDLLAGRGHCCFQRELPLCQVAHSSSYQVGACRLQQLGASSRCRPAASRSQHSFPFQCDEQRLSRIDQRTQPATSADDDDSTTSSKRLAPLDFGGSASRMASGGERWCDQLAPSDRGHIMSAACNHCDRHSNYLRQRVKPQARSNVMGVVGANPYRQHQYYYDRLQRNQTNFGPRCSLSSVQVRPFSDSNDNSNQSIARGAPKAVESRRSPSVAQRPHNAMRMQQHRQQSNSCSCSNDSLHRRWLNSPTRSQLRAIQQPLALRGALPTCSSSHLLLNASRLQEEQLVNEGRRDTRSTSWTRSPPSKLDPGQPDDHGVDAYAINGRSPTAVARQRGRQSSLIGSADIKRDKLRSSALSLGANQPDDRDPSTFESFEGRRREKANVLRNRSTNELKRKTPDSLSQEQQVPRLLCKCCCEHDECVRYALKQAASSEPSMLERSPIKSFDNSENANGQTGQAADPATNEEGSTIVDSS